MLRNGWILQRLDFMNHGTHEEKISEAIYNTLIGDLQKRRSCRCDLYFIDQEKRKSLLTQIMRKQRKLTKWEVIVVINKSAYQIQKKDPNAFPIRSATNDQIEKFAKKVGDCSAKYFSSTHSNTIALSTPECT